MDARVSSQTGRDLAQAACARRANEPLIHYFDVTLTGRDVATASDALASALAARGVGQRDRVALYMQNVPQWPIAAIAAWKLGAIVVPVNPMLRERELATIMADSGAKALIAEEGLPRADVDVSITTSPLEYLAGVPPRSPA